MCSSKFEFDNVTNLTGFFWPVKDQHTGQRNYVETIPLEDLEGLYHKYLEQRMGW